MDNDKRDLNGYQPAGTANFTGQTDSEQEEFGDCLEDLDMEGLDYGKALLGELDRLERELKNLD